MRATYAAIKPNKGNSISYGQITIGDLRKLIADTDLHDDSVVLVKLADVPSISYTQHGEGKRQRFVYEWRRYDTSEIHNAYTCNADRYEHNTIVLLELSGISD